jgi:hypothetical protein
MPAIRAIGVTDYYSTETYERVGEAKRNGRLMDCRLIFPNIEMRLGVGTVKGKWVIAATKTTSSGLASASIQN